MWIRSQDKELLINVEGLQIVTGIESIKLQCQINASANNAAIMGFNKAWYYIGLYNNKTRALDVLNNIEDIMIQCDGKVNDYDFKCYDMPKE